MKKIEKVKYEKPISMDAGKVATIQGQNCSNGTLPADECISGDDPDVVPICNATGSTATGNCEYYGSTAGTVCLGDGSFPALGCLAGGTY